MSLIRRSASTSRLAAAAWCLGVSSATVAQQAAPDVGDYVRDRPYGARSEEVAALYDSDAVPELIALLGSEEPYWGTVAGMLVVVGDERAVDALIAFVEKPVAVPALSNVYENARGRAIVGLGDLVRRTGSERALIYLIEGLTPQTWTKRNVRGVAQWTKSFEEYDSLLAEYAIYGLAYSGHPRAGEALRALQRSPTMEQGRFRKGLDNTLEQWLEVYDLVADRGLDGSRAFDVAQQRRAALLPLEDSERPNGPDAGP
jgi:HEAT repeat protein